MHIKLKLADLKEIQSILNEMKRDTENAITVLKQNTNTATNLMESFNDAMIEEIHQRIEDLEEISLFIGELEDKIDEIIEVVEFKVTITDEEAEFIYDAEKLTKTVNEIQGLLDINSVEFKSIINNSEDYKYWERQTTAKLDNPDAGLKDIVEEMKQRDDEKVFRHNRKIMQGLSAKMEYSLINTYIEDILGIKEELDALEELDDIEELAEILLNATSYGDVDAKSSDITVDNFNQVNLEKLRNDRINNTDENFLKIMKAINSGGKVTVAASVITDDINIIKQLKETDYFENSTNIEGDFIVSKKYPYFEDWLKVNSWKANDALEKVRKQGATSIYKIDEKTGMYYTFDEFGEKKYFSSLPKTMSKTVGGISNVLTPLGYTIDFVELNNARNNEQFYGVLGAIIGGIYTGTLAVSMVDPVAGDEDVLIFLADTVGSYFGGKFFGKLGKEFGKGLDNGTIKNEFK